MSNILRCLLLAPALLVVGCIPTLFTDEPFGEPAVLEPSDWNGLWVCSGFLTRFWISETGGLGVGDGRECQDKPESSDEGKFRRFGAWYVLGKCEGRRLDTGKPCETTNAARRYGESIVQLYEPDEANIKELVALGQVPGRIEPLPPSTDFGSRSERVVLHSLTVEHYKILLEGPKPVFKLVQNGEGPVFQCVKLPDELDPCNGPK